MIKILIILQSFFITYTFCADLSPSDLFIRFNEETQEVQVAYKTYQSPDGKTLVKLIGMCHRSLPSFFDEVGNLLKDNVVLYEMAGGTLEQKRQFHDRIKNLGELYWAVYEAKSEIVEGPNALGLIDQNYLSYYQATELIHADIPHNPECSRVHAMSDDELKSSLYSPIQNLIAAGHIDPTDDLIEQYKKVLHSSKILQTQEEALQELKEIFFSLIAVCEALRQGGSSELLKEDLDYVIHRRNQYVFDAFNLVLSREIAPPQIAIVYGTGHMPFVHHFLLAKKFTHLANEDGWLTAAILKN